MADEIHVHYVFLIPAGMPQKEEPLLTPDNYTQWMQIPFPEDESPTVDLPRRPYPPTTGRWE